MYVGIYIYLYDARRDCCNYTPRDLFRYYTWIFYRFFFVELSLAAAAADVVLHRRVPRNNNDGNNNDNISYVEEMIRDSTTAVTIDYCCCCCCCTCTAPVTDDGLEKRTRKLLGRVFDRFRTVVHRVPGHCVRPPSLSWESIRVPTAPCCVFYVRFSMDACTTNVFFIYLLYPSTFKTICRFVPQRI